MWGLSAHSARSMRARVTQAAANFVEHDAPAAGGCLPNLNDFIDDCLFDCVAQDDCLFDCVAQVDGADKEEGPSFHDFL